MAACEDCWTEASRRALTRGGATADHYHEVLAEAQAGPVAWCAQSGGVPMSDPDDIRLDVLIDCMVSFDIHGDAARAAAEYILSAASGLEVRVSV